jgi:ATP-dependent DNA helicase DinG
MNSEEIDPDTELVMDVSSLEKDAKQLIAWAKTPGVSGDRDDAPDVDRRVWAANSVSGRECVGADVCAFGSKCFAANAKAKAQLADIVVTNHTLLAIEIVRYVNSFAPANHDIDYHHTQFLGQFS